MNQESIHPAPARPAPRDARLVQWEQLMRRTTQAMRLGHSLCALATCHDALAVARNLVTARTADVQLQRGALRHARETHAGLLLHLETHGTHPAITRALQAGYLIFAAGPSTLH